MELKKSLKANLEKKRFVLIQIGLVVGLAFTLSAFEWTVFDTSPEDSSSGIDISLLIDEPIPVYTQKKNAPLFNEKKNVSTLPPIVVEEFIIMDTNSVADNTSLDLDTESFFQGEGEIDTIDTELDKILDLWNVDKKPTFPGCEDITNEEEKNQCMQTELFSQLYSEISIPEIVKELGAGSHQAQVKFVVMTDGSIDQVEVLNASRLHPAVVEEAKRVIKTSHDWIPARHHGQPVSVVFMVPITLTVK